MGKRTEGKAQAKAEAKRPRLQAKTSAAGAEAAAGEMEQNSSNENMVRTVINEIHDAINMMLEHPMFKDVVDQEPYNMSNGGAQAPFKQADMNAVLNKAGAGLFYKCGLHFMWQSFTWMTNHRVPINRGQIKELQRFALEPLNPPRHLPFETVIALDSATQCVMSAKGALQRLSPPEPAFAVIFSIRDSLIQEAGDDVLGKWRDALLTASFRFEVMTAGDERYWRAQNLRQEAIEIGIVSQLSVRQWIYDVVGFKASKEKDLGRELGSAQVAKYYHDKMKYARGTEGVSASFVDSAITVHRRVLSNSTARYWLEWCDEHLMEKSPWSKSIYALQALVDRAQTTERITWAICGLTDLYRMDWGSNSMPGRGRVRPIMGSAGIWKQQLGTHYGFSWKRVTMVRLAFPGVGLGWAVSQEQAGITCWFVACRGLALACHSGFE